MKGDVVVLEEHHRRAASRIVAELIPGIRAKPSLYVITVAGESGSGKSEMGKALQEELASCGVKAVVLGQDDYFVLPPRSNDARRRSDPEWLGPHDEVRLDQLEQNLKEALQGAKQITKPLVNYDEDTVEEEVVDVSGVRVIIAEGTYTSLLRRVDTRVFIARNRLDTLEHRQKRSRGKEVGDPFIEKVLKIEHKIIAGHQYLADIIITKEYDVVLVE
jgi:uridine kinase